MNKKLNWLILFSLLITGCNPFETTDEAVSLVWDKTGKLTDQLFIFLPGIFDKADSFQKEHFFSMAREAGIEADMVSAEIHLGHLIKGEVNYRLQEDIFQFIEQQGYKNIWLIGISLGGLNSLVYYQHNEQKVCGVVLLAPYLANNSLWQDIQKSGGLVSWQPQSTEEEEKLYQQKTWIWIKEQARHNKLGQLFLGYGKQDRFARPNRLLASLLAAKNTIIIDGKHDWTTWRKIWRKQLDSRQQTGLLASCTAAG